MFDFDLKMQKDAEYIGEAANSFAKTLGHGASRETKTVAFEALMNITFILKSMEERLMLETIDRKSNPLLFRQFRLPKSLWPNFTEALKGK